ncbi:hypothetical protein F1188_04770 [Roseospira marina]|uniref:Uncharacterized protein n=1 Tax=Roseospira marina TaxID=140057 RepID=A0A5M6IEV4_9PROT|nr:hypothetical protein [Roseospira marina]KAA5606652.1 hypothetical protein F1188_04770 [Roseospira marina]MBB4313941.1 hypothetical protein [Roseospira marina]MBB5087103.1 hypothetical protein [Roseospira marina]
MSDLAAIEVTGGIAGLLGSIVLAVPALLDLRHRALWDRLDRLRAVQGTTEADVDAVRAMLLDDLLGGYRLHARCTLGGGILLAVAFLCVTAAGLGRLTA